ncbi:MAG: hypothetical protein methR_P0510 [Methyloprofundus sp.]|nr:MAG: hypothetical protein methR_P0510 [Methyloprofundus sp.]
MTDSRHNFHKKTSFSGFIFISGTEYKIQVRDLSISGMLAAIDLPATVVGQHDLAALLKHSEVIDFYIEKLNLEGDARVTRVDKDDDHVLIGLEFKHISYDTEKFLNKREVYRKSMDAPGHIKISGKVYEFKARNVSVDGLMAYLPEHIDIQQDMHARFKFDELRLFGEVKVIWFEYDDQDGTLLGLKYEHMKTAAVKDIPQFYHDT